MVNIIKNAIILYGENVSYDFQIAGEYNITLTVTDVNENEDSDIVVVNIEPLTWQEQIQQAIVGLAPLFIFLLTLKLIIDYMVRLVDEPNTNK